MSEKSPAALIEDALNMVLIRQNAIEDEKRAADREAHRLSVMLTEADDEARRLRLALFALAGEPGGAGDANSANAKQRAELRRAR